MLCRSRIPWANDGLKNETIQCAGRVVRCIFVFCALLTLKVSNAAKRKNRCGAHSTGLCYSQIERVCSIAGRQVTLRSLTAFPFIASRQGNDGGFHPPSQRVEKVRLRRPFPSFNAVSLSALWASRAGNSARNPCAARVPNPPHMSPDSDCIWRAVALQITRKGFLTVCDGGFHLPAPFFASRL